MTLFARLIRCHTRLNTLSVGDTASRLGCGCCKVTETGRRISFLAEHWCDLLVRWRLIVELRLEDAELISVQLLITLEHLIV